MAEKPTAPSTTTTTAREPHKAPVDPHAETEVARLASNFGARTVEALALASIAGAGDDPEAHRRAARAALDAGRPAHARRLVARAIELDPDHPENTAIAHNAENEMKGAGRAIARGAEMFVNELYMLLYQARGLGLDALLLTTSTDPQLVEMVGDIAHTPGQVTGLDVVNMALARVGAGGVWMYPPLNPGGEVGVRRIQQRGSKDSTAAQLARVEAEGKPCERCGAPRWTFAHDAEHGEFCATCAWPLAPGLMSAHRRRLSNEQLEARVRDVEAERDTAHKGRRDAELAVKNLEGKIAKLTQTVEREGKLRQQLVAGGTGQASLAELSVDELAAAARGAAERAQASATTADAISVEIARREGRGAPQG